MNRNGPRNILGLVVGEPYIHSLMHNEATLNEKFKGCLLGLAIGDALGAEHEGGFLERLLWRAIGRTRTGRMRWTDDTQMSLDVAHSLVERGTVEQDDLARRFAASYKWSRGYGPGTVKLLKRVSRGMSWETARTSVYPSGSFGNGGAMRAPVLGLYFGQKPQELKDAVAACTSVTHSHPLGIDGALLIATCTASAMAGDSASEILKNGAASCQSQEFKELMGTAQTWLSSQETETAKEVVRQFGNRSTALRSCVTAAFLAARFLHSPLPGLFHFVAICGGDADTIGAMSGAIWGAFNGVAQIPDEFLRRVEGTERIADLAERLLAASIAEPAAATPKPRKG